MSETIHCLTGVRYCLLKYLVICVWVFQLHVVFSPWILSLIRNRGKKQVDELLVFRHNAGLLEKGNEALNYPDWTLVCPIFHLMKF